MAVISSKASSFLEIDIGLVMKESIPGRNSLFSIIGNVALRRSMYSYHIYLLPFLLATNMIGL